MKISTSRSRDLPSPRRALVRPSSQLGPIIKSPTSSPKKNHEKDSKLISNSQKEDKNDDKNCNINDSILCLTQSYSHLSNTNIIQSSENTTQPGVTIAKDGSYPVTAAYAKHKYHDMLTIYELTEINEYRDIYFIGKSISLKSQNGDFSQGNSNFYNAKVGDHIAYRYEILKLLGQGAFGQVLLCYDYKTQQNVALKILLKTPQMNKQGNIEANHLKLISPIPSSPMPSPKKSRQPQSRKISMSPSRQLKRQYSEINIKPSLSNSSILLSPKQKNDNPSKYVVQITDHFTFRNHICIVTECLGQSLWDYMKARTFEKQQTSTRSSLSQKSMNQDLRALKPLPLQLVKRIAFEVMSGLSVIHNRKIIHGDMKPENILFTLDNIPSDSATKAALKHVKIIDFGSSCKEGELVYNYIQSRYYRAPEVVLGANYGTEIDIWSVGCIIAELLMGKPLFQAQNEVELLFKFIETVGAPPPSIINMQPNFMTKPKPQKISSSVPITKSIALKVKLPADEGAKGNKFFSPDGKLLQAKTQPVPLKTPLSSFIKSSDKHLIDFISKCLIWEKEKRITAAAALSHPWLQPLNDHQE